MIGRFSDTSVYREIFKSKTFFKITIGGFFILAALYSEDANIFSTINFLPLFNKFSAKDIFLLVSVSINGLPVIYEAVTGLINREVNVDELVSIAIIACIINGNYLESAVVSLIMVTGAFIEEFISDNARGAIRSLVKINPEKALVEINGKTIEKKTKNIQKGDIIIAKAGEIIPVDGEIEEGSASVDESLLTGESFPVFKKEKNKVSAGTLNTDGYLKIKAAKGQKDSTLAKIIELVHNAENSNIKGTKLVDKYAGYFTPVILSIAILTYIFTKDITRAVTVLVVGCPCSFILTGPVATVAAVARAAKSGIMIKGGIYLENISKADSFYFDKTGTITCGKPVITSINTFNNKSEEEILKFASAVEQGSTHPIAESIIDKSKELEVKDIRAEKIRNIPGSGVVGEVEGEKVEVVCGAPGTISGETNVLIKINDNPWGEIFLFDKPRPEVKDMVKNLLSFGIKNIGIISGDSEGAVKKVAEETGFKEFYYRFTPSDKMNLINEKENAVFIGDGINDAPALKAALTGISMGTKASETALETADIVLMNDKISLIPFLLKLSRKMTGTIKTNIAISLGINLAAIVLGITGVLKPISGALIHNFGSILVVLISSSILFTKEFKNREKS
ncbi:MAG: cadmium-translocating P-type ATPase [Deltaproteobacteria bacterium]|nr:MAG: cadmium-translocating P-type ATPase [Deltaproteobacteria bacterium]